VQSIRLEIKNKLCFTLNSYYLLLYGDPRYTKINPSKIKKPHKLLNYVLLEKEFIKPKMKLSIFIKLSCLCHYY